MTAPTPVTDLFDLHGKVALVTGGSRGIGLAIATALGGAGADVVIASRKQAACDAAAARIAAQSGRTAIGLAAHVGHWDDCDRLAEAVYARFGRCDVLVNNAGMSPVYPALAEISESYWDKVTAVNLKGPFRLSATIGARMAAGEGGCIVNISSIGSLRPGANELVYACAKAGLNALTVGLAEAYGPHVRANTILPGGVRTDITEHWTPETHADALTDLPAGRLGTPQDLVGAALWLASPASAWVTGASVRVDGGKYRQTG